MRCLPIHILFNVGSMVEPKWWTNKDLVDILIAVTDFRYEGCQGYLQRNQGPR